MHSQSGRPFTLVETPLQISLFFAKQSQFQNGQYKHKYSKNKGLCQKTTNNEQRTRFKTNPIKPNFKRTNTLLCLLEAAESGFAWGVRLDFRSFDGSTKLTAGKARAGRFDRPVQLTAGKLITALGWKTHNGMRPAAGFFFRLGGFAANHSYFIAIILSIRPDSSVK